MSVSATPNRHFASDKYSGICPEAWAAMTEANTAHEISYGNDTWTQRASDLLRDIFETKCEVFFVFNGTAANSLSIAALPIQRWIPSAGAKVACSRTVQAPDGSVLRSS